MNQKAKRIPSIVESDPEWYKRSVIYQTHVRAFCDSNGDGIGDFKGLTSKLDYIRELGADVVWILPFYPSPLRDGGYDIADFTGINPDYGTLRDFERFVTAAHARDLKVMTELVLNHTSDKHPWFQRSRTAKPGTKWRDFYVWSDDPNRYDDARIIFKDFETSNWTWDPVAGQYFWHRFYSHQPDLNWDNPDVEAAMLKVLDFWLDRGVDGLRLDAIPYLYEREGTTCENLPETHGALKRVRAHLERNYPGRALLAEANQWPEDAVEYFGRGDECHMAFHFPIMPRLYMSTEREDRFPLIDIVRQTPSIPDNCQWVVFLRNHDELTLEMVSDEERDYMYRIFAADTRARLNLGIRRRLAPLLGNDVRKILLLNGLLFSLNGTPVVYYGDEIGMGDNIYLGDRDGVRTPMQWTADRNAGFSSSNPQRLYLPVIIDPEYHYETINVESQQHNPNSTYWWMRRLIALRRQHEAFAVGDIEFLLPENSRILVFVRKTEAEQILVVANLSRSVQYAELALQEYEGRVPIEVFGRTRFPTIGKLPYLLTLAPYGFYWFDISIPRTSVEYEDATPEIPTMRLDHGWKELTRGAGVSALERALPAVLGRQRWFSGKGKTLDRIRVVEVVDMPVDATGVEGTAVILLEARYEQDSPEVFQLPLAHVTGPEAQRRISDQAWSALLKTRTRDGREGLLVDALDISEFRRELVDAVGGSARDRGLVGRRTRYREFFDSSSSSVLGAEQSNTSVVYDQRAILKVFRKLEVGLNPDVEIGRHLTERSEFDAFPPVLGELSLQRNGEQDRRVLAVLQRFVPNQGEAWQTVAGELGRLCDTVLQHPEDASPPPRAGTGLRPRLRSDLSTVEQDLVGGFLPLVEQLAVRTAEMHWALASGDHGFEPEPFTPHYQRGLYQSMRSHAARILDAIQRLDRLAPEAAERVESLAERRPRIFECFDRWLRGSTLDGAKIRCHGDFHLGQVLSTANDWIIIDFEGEPSRPISERRLKQSPLRDVAGMLRSFDYAFHAAWQQQLDIGTFAEGSPTEATLTDALRAWTQAVSDVYTATYFQHMEGSGLLPSDREGTMNLLRAYRLDKAIYELGYEMNNRPRFLDAPISGIHRILAGG